MDERTEHDRSSDGTGGVRHSSRMSQADFGATTVEAEVRARLSAELGGLRGSLEAAVPLVVFTVAYLVTDDIPVSVIAAVVTAVAAYLLRLVQHSQTRFVRNGLIAIVIAAAFAAFTGRAEAAFLPGIIQNGLWALALAASLVVRRPLAGYLIGAVLEDPTGWRREPAIVRLGNRLTMILLFPMVVRLAVQIPLYLGGEVGWLGVSRVLLGWPLHATALAVAGMVLIRGRTPLQSDDEGD